MKKIVALILCFNVVVSVFAFLPDANIKESPTIDLGLFYVIPNLGLRWKLNDTNAIDFSGTYFKHSDDIGYTAWYHARYLLTIAQPNYKRDNIVFFIGGGSIVEKAADLINPKGSLKPGAFFYPEVGLINQTELNNNTSIRNAIGYPWFITNAIIIKSYDFLRSEVGLIGILPYFDVSFTF